jgi:predicted alpha/beta superfamily hydrolase
MKGLFLTLLNLFFTLSSFPQNIFYEVKFVVFAEDVHDSEFVYISGSDSLIGDWNPSAVKLEKIDDSTWVKNFNFIIGKNIEYKFTKGSWELEALNDDCSTPSNSVLNVTRDTAVSIKISKWKNKDSKIIHGQITGTVKYHRQFKADSLKPRDIIVWLPPSYYENSEKRYPVLYMHDGQNIFDPATSTFGYDWRLDEVADSLIRAGSLQEIIIVGIYNTQDRSREYSHSVLGYKYMDFIVSTLKPFIDTEYRTMPGKENTANGGSSLAGLISLMLVWNYPEVFSKAACISPAFKISVYNYVDTVINYSGKKKEIKLYIDNGGEGLESELQPGIDDMIIALQNKGYELGKDILWHIDLIAYHSETAWAARIWRPLLFFFGK